MYEQIGPENLPLSKEIFSTPQAKSPFPGLQSEGALRGVPKLPSRPLTVQAALDVCAVLTHGLCHSNSTEEGP